VTRTDGIADACQEVGYWIGEIHSFSFIPRSLGVCLNGENQRKRCCSYFCGPWRGPG
jgi:hypothetical protein